MSDVSVIGLGAMGAALARALLAGGHKVTVWNRTADKIAPLVDLAASGAASVAETIGASPVVLVCIDNYASTRALLEAEPAASSLPGRTLVQLSTGSPREARDSAGWVEARGGGYLDGAIMCYPDEIGGPGTLIMVGGRERAFKAAEPYLSLFCSDLRYLGDNVAAPAALDMAILATSVALYLGVAHAARMCESEGVSVGELARVAAHGDRPRERFEIIHHDAFPLNSLHGGGSLKVWADVVKRLQEHARNAGIDRELPDFLAGVYDRAVAAGHGAEDVAALVKVLRAG